MSQLPRPEDDEREGFETKPFLSHLEDLRWTIIRCLAALVVGVTVCAFGVKYILQALYLPYREAGLDPADLVNWNVVDPFSIHMEISLLGGFMLSLPALLFFLGQFLLPALTRQEKRLLGPVFAVGAVLFLIGVSFCYAFVLRTTLLFFDNYSKYLGFSPKWTAKSLIDFEVQMLFGFGIAFELPIVIFVLNVLGLVSAAQLASKRRHAALAIFVVATCIIPSTDLFSLSLLSVPMYLLYESCIWIARIVERRRASHDALT